MRKLSRPQVLLLAALLGAAPAAADWLVTREGGRIETKGPWKVEGRQVLFTQPNGTLSSIRADLVDLDLSAAESQREREAAARVPEPAKRPEPILRLTEKDLPPVPEAQEGAAEPPRAKSDQPVSSGLEVTQWERAETQSGEGTEIFGSVKNVGNANVTSPTLIVTLYDADGRLIATAEGRVNAAAVPPGQTASFRAVFPGVDDFAAARFDAQGTPFATRKGEGGQAGSESGEAATGEGVDVEPPPPAEGPTDLGEPSAPPPGGA